MGQIKGHPLLAWIPVDLTVVVAALVVLCVIASRMADGPARRTFAAPLVVWALFLPAVSLTVTWDAYAQTKIITLFTVTLALAIAPFHLMRFDDQRRRFMVTSVVVALLALSDAVFFSEPVVAGRLEFEGANTIGSARVAMAGALILILVAVGPGTRARWRLPAAALGVGAAVAALMTGSRGPVVAAGIALVATALVVPGLRRYRGRMILGLAALVGIAVWLARSSDGFERILLLLDENGTSQNSRLDLLELSGSLIGGEPLGTGWGTFSALNGFFRYPHNLLAEIGVEAGVFVLAVVIIGLLATVIRAARLATTPVTMMIFALLIFALFNAMVSGDINASRLMVVMVFTVWAMPAKVIRPVSAEDDRLAGTATSPLRSQRNPIRSTG